MASNIVILFRSKDLYFQKRSPLHFIYSPGEPRPGAVEVDDVHVQGRHLAVGVALDVEADVLRPGVLRGLGVVQGSVLHPLYLGCK